MIKQEYRRGDWVAQASEVPVYYGPEMELETMAMNTGYTVRESEEFYKEILDCNGQHVGYLRSYIEDAGDFRMVIWRI